MDSVDFDGTELHRSLDMHQMFASTANLAELKSENAPNLIFFSLNNLALIFSKKLSSLKRTSSIFSH